MKDQASIARIEATVSFVSLLARALAYALVAGFASRFPSGQAILTGVLVGDLVGGVVRTFVQQREHVTQFAAEVALLTAVLLFTHGDLGWPADSARQGILCLAALGVAAGRAGVTTRLGADGGGFA